MISTYKFFSNYRSKDWENEFSYAFASGTHGIFKNITALYLINPNVKEATDKTRFS